MAERWGWRETATDWRDVIARPGIDIADVAVPNSLPAEIAIAAAKAGKIVFCEKPLANSVAESASIRDAASSLPNMVWFNYRRVPAIQYLRGLIAANRLGRIFHFRAFYLQEWGTDATRPPNWKTEKALAGSGVLGDLMSHSIDLALHLNGPISSVQALQRTFAPDREIDDATLVLARFANGSVGTFKSAKAAPARPQTSQEPAIPESRSVSVLREFLKSYSLRHRMPQSQRHRSPRRPRRRPLRPRRHEPPRILRRRFTPRRTGLP
jgi:predicted dehydrogenase